jgi:hypothetical protein
MSGWRTALSVDLFLGGTVAEALLNLLLWAHLAAQPVRGISPFAMFPDWTGVLTTSAPAAGSLALAGLVGALLVPIYWLMMSFAAWGALHQLVTRLSFRETTDHGVSAGSKARQATSLRALGLE